MTQKKYKFIGAASGWGAQVRTCEDGPLFLKENGCLSFLNSRKIEVDGWEMLYPLTRFRDKNIPLAQVLDLILDFNLRLSTCVSKAICDDFFPVVIGGDHSNALGTWHGVAQGLAHTDPGPFGLIWIDAHMDAHTLETTPSGAWHGMPLASLMGYGTMQLKEPQRAQAILQPEHLCLIGTRSFEAGEEALLKQLQVKIYYIEEVKRRGLRAVLEEAIDYIHTKTRRYGVSLDVDVIDPTEAPGTGCFEPNGLAAEELLSCLPLIGRDEKLKAFELVEFNPHRDHEQKTFLLCQEILSTVLENQSCALPFC